MSRPKRIPTDGAQKFGHNPFDALSSEGFPPAKESLPTASTQLKKTKSPRKNRGRVDIIRQTAGRGGKTVVKGFLGIGLPEKRATGQGHAKGLRHGWHGQEWPDRDSGRQTRRGCANPERSKLSSHFRGRLKPGDGREF